LEFRLLIYHRTVALLQMRWFIHLVRATACQLVSVDGHHHHCIALGSNWIKKHSIIATWILTVWWEATLIWQGVTCELRNSVICRMYVQPGISLESSAVTADQFISSPTTAKSSSVWRFDAPTIFSSLWSVHWTERTENLTRLEYSPIFKPKENTLDYYNEFQ